MLQILWTGGTVALQSDVSIFLLLSYSSAANLLNQILWMMKHFAILSLTLKIQKFVYM